MAKKSMIAKASEAQAQGAGVSPLHRVRAAARLHATVRAVPHLLPGASAPRRAARRHQVELVGNPMNISDPIADMLTRVRNASRARHTEVVVPASRTKREIARILKDEGFIADVHEEQDGPTAVLRLTLKYGRQGPRRLGPQADQQARSARVRAQDRYPARAGRARHRHRQHEQGHHDRPAGTAGPARRRSPGVRLVGTMSRIGRLPIAVPSGVDVTIAGRELTVKGPKGTAGTLHPDTARRTARSSSPDRPSRRPTSSSTA